MRAVFGLLAAISLPKSSAQNGECSTAILLEQLPLNATGNTMVNELHLEAPAQACKIIGGPRRSSWYTFIPKQDGCITARSKAIDDITTEEDTGFDTDMAVFKGDCDALQCVGMNHEESIYVQDAVVQIAAKAGTEYFFMIAGKDNENQGKFQLTIEQNPGDCARESTNRYCNVCPHEGVPGADALFNPKRRILCTEASEYFGILHDDPEGLCDSLQLLGSAVCRCEYPVDVNPPTCNLCPDGGDVPQPDLFLDAIGETCGHVNTLEGTISCSEITRRGLASQCQCPGTPACDLCGDVEGATFDPSIELHRGTCGEAQSFLRDMFTAYPKFLGCDPSFIDFYFQANVKEVCCVGQTLAVVDKDRRTIPPAASPTGAQGTRPGNGAIQTGEPSDGGGSGNGSGGIGGDFGDTSFGSNKQSSGCIGQGRTAIFLTVSLLAGFIRSF